MSNNYKIEKLFYTAEELAKKWETNLETINYLAWDMGVLRPAIHKVCRAMPGSILWPPSRNKNYGYESVNYIYEGGERRFSRPDILYINVNHTVKGLYSIAVDYGFPQYLKFGLSNDVEVESHYSALILLTHLEDFEGTRVSHEFKLSYQHTVVHEEEFVPAFRSEHQEQKIGKENVRNFIEHKTLENSDVFIAEEDLYGPYPVVMEYSVPLAFPVLCRIETVGYFYSLEEVERFEKLDFRALIKSGGIEGRRRELVSKFGSLLEKRDEISEIMIATNRAFFQKNNRDASYNELKTEMLSSGMLKRDGHDKAYIIAQDCKSDKQLRSRYNNYSFKGDCLTSI